MEKVDITIIGAGIVGLAIAAKISQRKKSLYVIERHDSFGKETSSRNSEVIHAGIYYPKDSLKARTCIAGNRLLYEISEKNNIAHKKIGKLIVANTKAQLHDLEKLFENAKVNGVCEVELITKNKTKQLEPNITAEGAIYSKTTGIVNSHDLMKYFAFKAKARGTTITYSANVKNIKKTNKGYEVSVADSSNEEFVFLTQTLINCAGLESDSIAALVGIDIGEKSYKLQYCKGQYFNVSNKKSSFISRLIYPTPTTDANALGIHATLNLAGTIRLGPDDEYINRETADYNVKEEDKHKFFNSAVNFLPFLELNDLSPDTSGIRPKLQGPDEPFRDFVIKEETELGFPGFINLIGIESPGLTAAPAIAELVDGLV